MSKYACLRTRMSKLRTQTPPSQEACAGGQETTTHSANRGDVKPRATPGIDEHATWGSRLRWTRDYDALSKPRGRDTPSRPKHRRACLLGQPPAVFVTSHYRHAHADVRASLRQCDGACRSSYPKCCAFHPNTAILITPLTIFTTPQKKP